MLKALAVGLLAPWLPFAARAPVKSKHECDSSQWCKFSSREDQNITQKRKGSGKFERIEVKILL